MQNAKDSFYIALRNRLQTLNPARTIRVRGVQRASLLVEDAEAATMEMLEDVFILRWTTAKQVEGMPTPLWALGCEILYQTSGTLANAGLDRGRSFSEMDRELTELLKPSWTPKMRYTATSTSQMLTNVFWTELEFGQATSDRNALRRVAKATIYSFEEAGEL